MNKLKVVIVEDEALIADHIASVLENAGYDVLSIFDEANSFLAYLQTTTPDVILLDIQLNGELDGVDIAHEINRLYQIPIVFLTSNTDKRTIERVKRIMPASFISKPYTAEGLVSNLEIALHNYKEQNANNSQNIKEEDAIFLKEKNELIKIQYSWITHIQAMDNYAIIHTEKEKYIVPYTLKKLESDLISKGFLRSHRSYLVNKDKITSILPKAIMIKEIEIPLAESLRAAVLSQLKML